jgi:hypothetical protein
MLKIVIPLIIAYIISIIVGSRLSIILMIFPQIIMFGFAVKYAVDAKKMHKTCKHHQKRIINNPFR